jgi:hypothetical protein
VAGPVLVLSYVGAALRPALSCRHARKLSLMADHLGRRRERVARATAEFCIRKSRDESCGGPLPSALCADGRACCRDPSLLRVFLPARQGSPRVPAPGGGSQRGHLEGRQKNTRSFLVLNTNSGRHPQKGATPIQAPGCRRFDPSGVARRLFPKQPQGYRRSAGLSGRRDKLPKVVHIGYDFRWHTTFLRYFSALIAGLVEPGRSYR